MAEGTQFTPALGRAEWTGFYDLAIAVMTREGRWRRALVQQIAPRANEVILDVGCGTGTMALALKQAAPAAQIVGLDPDEDVLARAVSKAARRELEIAFH